MNKATPTNMFVAALRNSLPSLLQLPLVVILTLVLVAAQSFGTASAYRIWRSRYPTTSTPGAPTSTVAQTDMPNFRSKPNWYGIGIVLKRSVFPQFSAMIRKTTGRSPLNYFSYGCYCGLGGSGTAVDETDRCCELHDHCYANARKQGCFPYLVHYSYAMSGKSVVCSTSSGRCGQVACACDSAAAECMATAKFSKSNIRYNQKLCRAKTISG